MDATALSPLGQRVMERLWRDGPGTVGEVLEPLNHGSSRPLAYTTVMTILTRLLDRGIVTREKEGRLYRYTAAFSQAGLGAEIGRRELRKLIDRHGASSLAAFAAELGDPDDELAARLRELAGRSRAAVIGIRGSPGFIGITGLFVGLSVAWHAERHRRLASLLDRLAEPAVLGEMPVGVVDGIGPACVAGVRRVM